jgi:hypothetical protein
MLLCGCGRAPNTDTGTSQATIPTATITLTQPIHLYKHVEVIKSDLINTATQKAFTLLPGETIRIPLGEYGRAIFYHLAGSPTGDVKLIMDNMICTNEATIHVTLYEHEGLRSVMVAESRTWTHN